MRIPTDSRMNVEGYEWLKKRLESAAGQDKIQKREPSRLWPKS